jgi:chemotaxis signal transduction protein
MCAAGARLVGLIVDDAWRVLDYPASALGNAAGVGNRLGTYLAGLIRTDNTTVPLLDVARVLAADELL